MIPCPDEIRPASSRFQQFYSVVQYDKRDNADKFIFFENHEHFGIAR